MILGITVLQILGTTVIINCLNDFSSFDRLKLTFAQLIIKLKPLLSCTITEIAMERSFLLP